MSEFKTFMCMHMVQIKARILIKKKKKSYGSFPKQTCCIVHKMNVFSNAVSPQLLLLCSIHRWTDNSVAIATGKTNSAWVFFMRNSRSSLAIQNAVLSSSLSEEEQELEEQSELS